MFKRTSWIQNIKTKNITIQKYPEWYLPRTFEFEGRVHPYTSETVSSSNGFIKFQLILSVKAVLPELKGGIDEVFVQGRSRLSGVGPSSPG